MMTVTLFDAQTKTISKGGSELIDRWEAGDAESVIWVDLHGEEAVVESRIMDQFGVHPLAQHDVQRARQPPKIERFENCLFVLLRGIDQASSGVDFGVMQLGMFIGRNFLLTVHAKASLSCAFVLDRLDEGPDLIADGPGRLCTTICGRLTRRYVEILLDLEARLEDVEQEIFTRPSDDQLSELTSHKSRLREIQRIARYHTVVASGLRRQLMEVIEADLEHELNDVYEQVERALSLATYYYDYAKDLTDGYLALSAHRLNGVMQILTVITVIFVPLTFIAGIYGMNFQNMPELAFEKGYFVVLGFMMAIGASLLVLFRRRGWL